MPLVQALYLAIVEEPLVLIKPVFANL